MRAFERPRLEIWAVALTLPSSSSSSSSSYSSPFAPFAPFAPLSQRDESVLRWAIVGRKDVVFEKNSTAEWGKRSWLPIMNTASIINTYQGGSCTWWDALEIRGLFFNFAPRVLNNWKLDIAFEKDKGRQMRVKRKENRSVAAEGKRLPTPSNEYVIIPKGLPL
jgi:hypothetical protein